jgi:hypothetical protein
MEVEYSSVDVPVYSLEYCAVRIYNFNDLTSRGILDIPLIPRFRHPQNYVVLIDSVHFDV